MRPLPAGRGRSATALTWLTWVLAALAATAVAWSAVSAVGRTGGTGATTGVLSQDDVAQALAGRTTPTPAATPRATPGPSATAVPTAEPTTEPAPDPPTATAPPPAAAEVARVWDVTGGQVGASCTGPAITLLYATPSDGWAVEIKNSGPEELEVVLRRAESETRVRAVCVAGTPERTAETAERGGGDGGGDD